MKNWKFFAFVFVVLSAVACTKKKEEAAPAEQAVVESPVVDSAPAAEEASSEAPMTEQSPAAQETPAAQ